MPTDDPAVLRSERLFRLFGTYLGFSAGRRFRALRISGTPPMTVPPDRPVIVFTNHPSWWDPALFILLSLRHFPGRPGFGPMEEEALARYGLFRRFGVFGISKTGVDGARRFLRLSRSVLAEPGGAGGRPMLWVTAEGAFTDPRIRPVRLRPGIAHLASAIPDAVLLPLAIEYVFWNESRPEALMRFGTPLDADPAVRPAEWILRLEAALTETMDRLAADAQARDPARFELLRSGTAGIGGPYDWWRRARAWTSGQRFDAAHGSGT
jgi:hypothetical protein